MRDIGNEETEKLIADLEKKIRREYEQAEKELNEKFNEYVRKFKIKDEIKKQQLARGEITQEFYDYWRKGQFSVAFRWQEMRRTMADDLTTVSQKARSIVDGYRGEAYAINHDYITFLIEKDSGIDTSYTLYNTRSAERLLKGDEVLPRPGKRIEKKIERGEVVKWQEGRIQSVTLQSLLQGESTEHMAQRICRTLSVSNYADAVRYARTAMTGAQNGGRFDAISRCREEGIDVVGQWSATLDGRTRHTHRQIDGEVVEPGEMFSNGCRFPGDPNGPPAEIWRCRCRLNERVRGYTKDPSDLTRRNTDHMEEDSYEAWKNKKSKNAKNKTSEASMNQKQEKGTKNKQTKPAERKYHIVKDDKILYEGRATLSEKQKDYLNQYSVMSGTINSYLRMPEKLEALKDMEIIKEGIPAIDKAIAESMLNDNIKVFRTVDKSYLPDKLRIGEVIEDKAYNSTSIKKDVVDRLSQQWNFVERSTLEIHVPSGKGKGIYIHDLAAADDQFEFLIKRNSRYKVTEIKKDGTICILML